MSNYSPVDGTFDLFPDHHKYLTFLKKVFRHEFRKNGFRRMSTPVIERKDLLEKLEINSGLFMENDNAGIRPNSNIGVMRAYLNSDQTDVIQPVYYYYMDKYYHKTAKGFRGKDLIGGEIIGEDDPILDALQIYITYTALNKIGLKDKFKIKINSVGIEKEKVKYREELVTFYDNKRQVLSPESEELIDKDPMQILHSLDEDDKILNESAPKFVPKFLKKDSKAHYSKFVEYLDILEVPYEEDHTITADFAFQTKSVWKFEELNGKTISKGARYNDLAKMMGETKEVPATGFFVDTARIIRMLQRENISLKNKDEIDLFIVQLGDEAKKVVLPLSLKARDAGINTVVSLGTPSMKEQMLKANRSNAKYVVMVGVMEARNGLFQVRNQEDGTQEEIQKENLIDYMIEKIGTDNLDFYSPEKDLIIGEKVEIQEEEK